MNNNNRPAHDEWGVYDPEQAGFEAILRKLTPDAPKKATVAPDQPRPAAAPAPQAPTAEEDNGIWMTPASALKSGTK